MNFNVFMWPHLNAIDIAVHQLSVMLYLRIKKAEKTSTLTKNQNKEAKEENTSPTEVGC